MPAAAKRGARACTRPSGTGNSRTHGIVPVSAAATTAYTTAAILTIIRGTATGTRTRTGCTVGHGPRSVAHHLVASTIPTVTARAVPLRASLGPNSVHMVQHPSFGAVSEIKALEEPIAAANEVRGRLDARLVRARAAPRYSDTDANGNAERSVHLKQTRQRTRHRAVRNEMGYKPEVCYNQQR